MNRRTFATPLTTILGLASLVAATACDDPPDLDSGCRFGHDGRGFRRLELESVLHRHHD